jgi:hypothetical protein
MNLPEDTREPDDPIPGAAAPVGDKALVMRPLPSLLIALLAGVVVWAVLNAIQPVFHLPEHLAALTGNVTDVQAQALRTGSAAVIQKNTTLTLAATASVLALTLAAAELLFRRQPVRAVWGGLLAGVIAGGAGVGAAALGAVLMTSVNVETPLTKTMIIQGGMLGVIGLGVGLAIAIPIFRPRLAANCMIGGLLGGVLAAFVFPMLVSLMPRVNTEQLVPERLGLLLWISLAYGLIGATMAGLGKEKPKPSPAAPPSPRE